MSDVCRICGLPFGSPAFGGPGICPACDCGIQPVEAHRALVAELADWKDRFAKLEAMFTSEWFNRVTYKTERNAAQARVAALEPALRGLYDDNIDYLRINNLGGYDNHWLVAARKALGITTEST